MRLHDFELDASYYTDPLFLKWPHDKRAFYLSLLAVANDEMLVRDDMFDLKLLAWPSPLDADMTVELFEKWRDEMIESGVLKPYMIDGKRYLEIRYVPGGASR